ncbi:MAG TPA: hypothetical protein VKT82_09770 [Ktedonobacterales bacterium]|nr:hypothetical protein [Ktedonobacterales bacterium]
MIDSYTPPFIFGIYPGSVTSADTRLAGRPDEPTRIQAALSQLQTPDQPLLVRGYLHFKGSLPSEKASTTGTPHAVEQYAQEGRKLDLVLCFRQPDLSGWLDFVRQTIHRYGALLATLQITEEANLTTFPEVDGCIPHVREALVSGVIAAKEEARRRGLDMQVGFNAALNFDPTDDFWPAIAALGGQPFLDALDYVGLDFFPDVFRPLAPDGEPGDVRQSVSAVLAHFRQVNLVAAGIPASVPIHITENAWPTGPTRSAERQAAVLETVIRAIHQQRARFNITHYEHHGLRDADSSNPNLFFQFGLLRDDYTPKPAFERYRQLIAALGAA